MITVITNAPDFIYFEFEKKKYWFNKFSKKLEVFNDAKPSLSLVEQSIADTLIPILNNYNG